MNLTLEEIEELEKADLLHRAETAEAKLRAAEEALDALYVLQNGAPLIEDAEEWNAAMKKASDILAGHAQETDHIEDNLTMVSDRERRLEEALNRWQSLFCDSDMWPEDECHECYDFADAALSSAPTPQAKVRIA